MTEYDIDMVWSHMILTCIRYEILLLLVCKCKCSWYVTGGSKISNKPTKVSSVIITSKLSKKKKSEKPAESVAKVTCNGGIVSESSKNNQANEREDSHDSSEGEIIGLDDLEQMAARASKRNSTFSMEEECLSKRNSQHSADGEPVVTTSVKCVRFNMEPEINQFEVMSSQSEAPTDSESERPVDEVKGHKKERISEVKLSPSLKKRTGGPTNAAEQPEDLNTNLDPSEFGVDGPVMVVADVSCQTDDELDDDDDDDEPGESDPFLPEGSNLETTTEFHDTHQTVYIHQSPQGSPQEADDDVANCSTDTQTQPQSQSMLW